MQDLVDTARSIESQMWNLDDFHLLNAAGKENLGGGIKVGVTVTLNDAKVAFEERPGPSYTQCNISGGNLVAIDSVGDDLNPIHPTAFTQIVLANSSSATLSEQTAIQYASFNGGVAVDLVNGIAGTEYNIGTPQNPSNNMIDSYAIAVERGFPAFYFIGDADLADEVASYDGFIFVGESKTKTTIDIDPAASVAGCEFYNATITGTLDGNAKLVQCRLTDLNYIYGVIEECILDAGTITLGGNDVAHLSDCKSGVPGLSTPVIDMGGAGQALAIRNYSGGIKLINKTGPEKVSVDLDPGQCIIDTSTVTNGEIVIRGVGRLVDQNGDRLYSGTYGSMVLYADDLVNPTNIAKVGKLLTFGKFLGLR